METAKDHKPTAHSRPQFKGTLILLEFAIGTAFILATLFTAWTPYSNPDSTQRTTSFVGLLQPTIIPVTQATPTPSNEIRVGIVAGHWGNDSGAVCPDGLTETEVNQRVAALVQKALLEEGLQVDVLQEFDTRLSAYRAAALVSIHADSCDYVNDMATGFKVAAALASKRPERSARLTACLRNRYAIATGLALHSTSVTNDMTNYHAFEEIDTNTPAAIIEVGFLNLDRQLLEKQPELPAQGIIDGILCFLRNEDITSPTPAITPSATP